MNKIDVYMRMAEEVAQLSPDAETQVGAIMLSPDGRIIASSYNGFLRGAIDELLPSTRPDKYEYMQHAERNLIYNCAYEGIRTKDTHIVCTLSPCTECLRACFQAGVKFIYFDQLYSKFPNTDFYKELKDVFVFVSKRDKYTCLELHSVKYAQDCGWLDEHGKRLVK